jgi:hypothetical protein
MKKFATSVFAAAVVLASSGAALASQCPTEVSADERLLAINAVENLMGRYSTDFQEGGLGAIADMFATKTPGVSWKVPKGPSGKDLVDLLTQASKGKGPSNPWSLHMHTSFSPVVEVAADGKTALGVWDSFGPSINGPDDSGWDWNKYGVDFIKEDGVWKIWHLQVFPVFSTPYGTSVTDTAKANAAKGINAAEGDTGRRPPSWTGPNDPLWIFDGKTSLRGPKTPRPYCTYSPELSAAQYAKF